MIVFFATLLSSQPGYAFDCQTVRAYVARYGRLAAMSWAYSQGYTRKDVAMVRRECFGR
jgi:hypothetical protein